MSYKDKINSLKEYDYSQYKDISSCEKLMVFVAYTLQKNNVPLTFNYLCISSFKMFPEKFCLDEEFKEFPSVDRLNRTYMHLKYVKKGKPYITGTQAEGYKLTTYGESIAEEVGALLGNSTVDKTISAPPVDKHKKGVSKDYSVFKESEGFEEYKLTGKVDIIHVFEFFNITPYTRIKMVSNYLEDILGYAKQFGDKDLEDYVSKAIEILKPYK